LHQKVRRHGVELIANNWEHPDFAVSNAGELEVGSTTLLHYNSPDPRVALHIPIELIRTHEVTADEFEGVIDTSIEYERAVKISMFHSDEVNEEAILFANWAYRLLHEAIVPHRYTLAGSHLCWLLQLPYAIEILASTGRSREDVITECAATSIIYKDFESKQIRRSFTCQFHPELLADIRQIGKRPAPSYAELKEDDGVRLFARLLYNGMLE
jgi:hypothetical protein